MVRGLKLPKKWVLFFLILLAGLVWVALLTAPANQLEVSFLDVGQGDAILIQKGTQQVLVDGGPDPDRVCLELGKRLPFWDRRIELVVLTHPEDDHLIGLVEVLRRYKVGQVLEPDLSQLDNPPDSPAYKEWCRLIEEKGIRQAWAKAGQQIELRGGIRIEVFHPRRELLKDTSADINNNSIVMRLVWDKVSFLLTGDIYEEAEREILHWGYKLESIVLKIAHHGSKTSTSEPFLAAVDPEVAVICVGKENPFQHPHNETLARLKGIKIYRTDEQGAITLITDGEGLWVRR